MTTIFLQDAFTEADDTALESHTPAPTGGGSWEHHDVADITVSGSNGYAISDDDTANYALWSGSPPSDDYTITAILESQSGRVGAAFRFDDTTKHGYICIVRNNSTLYLYEVTNGSESSAGWTVGSDAIDDFSSFTEYTLVITVSGSSIDGKLYDGAVEKAHVYGTDSTYSTGDVGIYVRNSAQLKDIKFEYVAAGGSTEVSKAGALTSSGEPTRIMTGNRAVAGEI